MPSSPTGRATCWPASGVKNGRAPRGVTDRLRRGTLADMADDDFDVIRFLESATELVDQYVHGESGLLGVRRVVDIGHWALPALGMTFVEFGPVVGRYIATSGDVGAALGRRVNSGDPALAAMLAGERVVAVDVAA